MKRLASVIALVVLVAATSAWAQPARRGALRGAGPGAQALGGPGGGAGLGMAMGRFGQNLFPPELVLRNQIAIDLSDDQTAQIKRLLTEAHGRIAENQVDLQRAMERLRMTLDAPRVDEREALAAAERTMAIEMRLKKEHLALLVRVKNILTEEQQEQLAKIRGTRAGRADDAP
jgi:Spy/CpxP family protein refolding chaperone